MIQRWEQKFFMHLVLHLLVSPGRLCRAEEPAEPMNYPEWIWRMLCFRSNGAALNTRFWGVMLDMLVKTWIRWNNTVPELLQKEKSVPTWEMEQVFLSKACLQKLLGPRLRSSCGPGGPGAETAVTAVKAVVVFSQHILVCLVCENNSGMIVTFLQEAR